MASNKKTTPKKKAKRKTGTQDPPFPSSLFPPAGFQGKRRKSRAAPKPRKKPKKKAKR